MTRDEALSINGVDTVTSLDAALALVHDEAEVMIIGGGAFYRHCLPMANKLYLTFIDANIEGDTQFPEWGGEWCETYREAFTADEKNQYDMSFVVLENQ